MSIREKLVGIDSRFPWSFTGVVLAVAFGVIGPYSLFHEDRPSLVCEIESQSDVLDLHRPLTDLVLSFRGQDIQQQNLNLRIYSVRLSNKGRKDVLQGYYDQDGTWGIKVQPGQVIEVRIGQTNSPYLASNIGRRITSESTITLNKVIFERDKFVTLEILVLHHKDSPPKISAFGKIAGIDEIPVVDASALRGKPSLWEQVEAGSPFVHILRAVAYITLLIAGAFAINGVSRVITYFRNRGRRRRAESVAETSSLRESTAFGALKESYAEHGIDGLKRLQVALKNDGLVRGCVSRRNREAQKQRVRADLRYLNMADHVAAFGPGELGLTELQPAVTADTRVAGRYGFVWARDINRLIDEGLVSQSSEGRTNIDPALTSALEELVNRLA